MLPFPLDDNTALSICTIANIITGGCLIAIATKLWLLAKNRCIKSLLWVCALLWLCGSGRIFGAYMIWHHNRPFLAMWTSITALVSVIATYAFFEFLSKKGTNVHLNIAAKQAIEAMMGQDFINKFPFPTAYLSTDGSILATNDQFDAMMGANINETGTLGWLRCLDTKEKLRVIDNWTNYKMGSVEYFYEEFTWTNLSNKKLMRIYARGRKVDKMFICEFSDISILFMLDRHQKAIEKVVT